MGQTDRVQQSDIGSVLVGSPLFLSLDREAVAAVTASCVQRTFVRGQYLFHQGDVGEQLYIVATGLVKVVFTLENGDEMVLATLGPGQVLGELALLDRVPRSASVLAVQPSTTLMLDRSVLLALMRSHPSVMDAMMVRLGGLVRRLTEQAGDLAFLDIASRLAKLLLRLSYPPESPDTPRPLVQLSQTEIAAMIGASRPAVNRALHSMADRGLIDVNGQAIVVRDLEGLRRRASG
jgi:CRP/FNR family cyclic AMP-dependent transcriptional regulator